MRRPAMLLLVSMAACAAHGMPPPPPPSPPPQRPLAPPSFDDAFVAREREAVLAIRRSGRRMTLLEPSGTSPGKGRFPARWKDFDAVLLRLQDVPTNYDGDLETGISVWWRSPALDGSLYLVLTDEQISVRSGHDNPNDNHLYWLASISPAQRAAVAKLFARRALGEAIDCGQWATNGRSPHAASEAEDCRFRAPHAEKASGDDHLSVTTKNVAALLTSVNRALPKDVALLPVPAAGDLERRVVISTMADALRDSLRAQ